MPTLDGEFISHNAQLRQCLGALKNESLVSDSLYCIGNVLTKHFSDEHHEAKGDHLTSYHLAYYFEFAVEFVNSIAGLIVLFAVMLACLNLFLVTFNTTTGYHSSIIDPFHSLHRNKKDNSIQRIRVIMGEQIALSLALLVASDILDTVLKPAHAYDILEVVKMGFVTILRTGLAYFLAKEIKELEEGKSFDREESSSEAALINEKLRKAEFRRGGPTAAGAMESENESVGSSGEIETKSVPNNETEKAKSLRRRSKYPEK